MKLTAAQIEVLLRKASFAPSGDNCQPWIYDWSNGDLIISHDGKMSEHPLNPGNASSTIMFGCLLESIEVAASEFHFKAEIQLLDLTLPGTSPWARIRFVPSTLPPSSLGPALEIRSTDRREFQKGTLDPKDFSPNLESYKPAQIHFLSDVPKDLVEYILDSEQNLIDHPQVLSSIGKWTRFYMKQAIETGDGLSWKNMLVKFWEIPVLYLTQTYPAVLKLVKPAMIPQHRARTLQQLNSAAGLICVSAGKSQAPLQGAVQVGRLMMNVWLRLTEKGYGVQPMSLATFAIYFKNENVMDSFFSQRKDRISEGEKVLKKAFQIPADQSPVWMIRAGKAEPLPQALRTFRRNIHYTVDGEKRSFIFDSRQKDPASRH